MPVTLQRIPGDFPPSLRDLLERSRLDSLLIVVPTRRRIRHVSREVLRLADRGVSPALPIHTLETLATSLFQLSPRARRMISTALQTLLFDRAIREAGDVLRYFTLRGSGRRMFPGTFDTMVNVVTLLKEIGLTPALLEEEAEAAPLDEQAKLRDVAAVYRAYNEQLEQAGAIDLGGIYTDLTSDCSREQFVDLFRRAYPEATSLSLAGFDQFTPPEMDFLERLAGIPGLAVSLRFDFQHGNPRLFGHLEENYRRFLRLGFEEVRSGKVDRALHVSPPLRAPEVERVSTRIGEGLFLSRTARGRTHAGGRIRVLRARTRREEIATICRLIKQMVADRPDRDLSAICVSMVRPQRYTEIVREQFDRFGIPANITDRYSLHRSPLIASVIALLQMVARGYARDDVLRVLESQYFRFADELDAAALALVSSLLRITGGARSWRERIDRRLRVTSPTGRSWAESWSSPEEERHMLERARADVEQLFDLTAPLSGRYAPAAFETRLVQVLETVGLPSRLLARGDTAEVERDVRAYARLREVLHETVQLMERHEGSDRLQSLRSMTDTLRLAVMRERYNVREELGRGVLVTSIDETRGLAMEVMFVAGLVDGEFPAAYEPEVFLSARRQREREQWHLWQERYLFYQAVTNWSEALWITYPELEGELELVRSPFVDELNSIVDTPLIEAETAPEVLCSDDEVLSWYARRGQGATESPGADVPSLADRLGEINRVVEIERSRILNHALPQFEGMLGGALTEAARSWLEERRRAVFSVSQLESYAGCPFRYFAERLLQLAVPEEFSEEWTLRERGSLLHRILYEFQVERRALSLPPLAACDQEEFARARHRLREIAEQFLSAIDVPDPFWSYEREVLLGVEGRTSGVLEDLLITERDRSAEPVPRFFEVTFGGGGTIRDPEIDWPEAVVVGDLRLRGRIDRLDLAEDHFTVVDYKTGTTVPSVRDLEEGFSLQLPLYIQAAEQILSGFGYAGLRPAAGMFVQVRKPVRVRVGLGNAEYLGRAFTARESIRATVPDAESLRKLCEVSVARARECVDGIASGAFPLAEASRVARVCRPCPFKTMCRIQALRRVTPAESEGA